MNDGMEERRNGRWNEEREKETIKWEGEEREGRWNWGKGEDVE